MLLTALLYLFQLIYTLRDALFYDAMEPIMRRYKPMPLTSAPVNDVLFVGLPDEMQGNVLARSFPRDFSIDNSSSVPGMVYLFSHYPKDIF